MEAVVWVGLVHTVDENDPQTPEKQLHRVRSLKRYMVAKMSQSSAFQPEHLE